MYGTYTIYVCTVAHHLVFSIDLNKINSIVRTRVVRITEIIIRTRFSKKIQKTRRDVALFTPVPCVNTTTHPILR